MSCTVCSLYVYVINAKAVWCEKYSPALDLMLLIWVFVIRLLLSNVYSLSIFIQILSQ